MTDIGQHRIKALDHCLKSISSTNSV